MMAPLRPCRGMRGPALLVQLGMLILSQGMAVASGSAVSAENAQALTEGDITQGLRLETHRGSDDISDQMLQDHARELARTIRESHPPAPGSPFQSADEAASHNLPIQGIAHDLASNIEDNYFKGRYNRSRARLPDNVETWRSRPDIANPGADLANFPNSAFTLPQGRAYIEMSPLTYYGPATGQPAQFNSEFLLRYGLTDNVEARIFGNGVSWQGGKDSTAGFSPVAFDTKIHLMSEMEDWHLPAIGFEAYLQTTWLGNEAFNQGTTPGFFLNFDQSLPFEIDFEYNLGATEQLENDHTKAWQFSLQWAFQRDIFNKDLAVFIHGFYNAMTLPRLPGAGLPHLGQAQAVPIQNAVGAGMIWTPNHRLSLWAQSAMGTTPDSPSVLSNLGFAVAF